MSDEQYVHVAPETMTAACARFFHDSFQSEMLSQIALFTFVHPGRFSRTFSSFLREWGRDHPDLQETFTDEVLERIARGTSGTEVQRHLSEFLLELIHCRTVDAFLMYVTDLSAEVFSARPETLRSGEQVRVDDILRYSNMEEVRGYLAERQVTKLSHKGFEVLAKDFERRFGVELTTDSEDRAYINRMVSIRNLIVHNHGVINDHFIVHARDFFDGDDPRHFRGKQIQLDPESVITGMHRLRHAAANLDERVAPKFGLERTVRRDDMITWVTVLKDLLDQDK